MEDLSVDSLILACKTTFSEYGLHRKILSDAGGDFISDKFKTFCKNLNTLQAVSSSYHHQCNGQVEACIKFIMQILKRCFYTKFDPCKALLQIRIPLGAGLCLITQ